ncbi:nucleotide 5'-monophosphate nucleosidase PpnN [Parahaliea mediterranea]|uniref:AMP nucleosidase n=1 Tax=Parahaliea mediterranea TaxID=651086 RepID=A0A939DFH5_9GAMM|nr:nucleotide 5'-monophosphate nucleosidase PpnN [Parahaliea mediterranea]MBN7796557.1 LOG family protein [Parahaliea mediterranea]
MHKIPHTVINPISSLNLLSQVEIEGLTASRGELYTLFRNCALAILNTDSSKDDAAEIYADYSDFDIRVVPQPRGLRLELFNAPGQSFVDGRMIRGIREHLFSALRDIVYTDFKITGVQRQPLSPEQITNTVFRILRNANLVQPGVPPKLVVCWGGHAIPREEYDFAKQVGYELGLRGLDIGTGCGIGAMKGPMKGAAVGHAKQQIKDGRYIGISEPGIIASESPNAIVNELVIMPDIEKRLEAFVRLAHAIIVFPGGVGTVEEVLYLLSILMHPDNANTLPLIFAGPESCRGYFDELNGFLETCLGPEVRDYYKVIIGQPEEVGRAARKAVERVHNGRRKSGQAYYFNWALQIDPSLQEPFLPTHQNMAGLNLSPDLPRDALASQLRRAFSGLVAGNVKAFGIEQVRQHGPYRLQGDRRLMQSMDGLLRMMVRENRMKLGECAGSYQPCYELV